MKLYELLDHLGNVRAVVGDVKLTDGSGGYKADLKSYTNYYPFGMTQPNRSWSASTSYSFGFNGMLKDNEIKGEGNSYDFGARIYDPRVGRCFNRDPLETAYTGLSPYSFVGNMAITARDIGGEEIYIANNNPLLNAVRELLSRTAIGRSIEQNYGLRSLMNHDIYMGFYDQSAGPYSFKNPLGLTYSHLKRYPNFTSIGALQNIFINSAIAVRRPEFRTFIGQDITARIQQGGDVSAVVLNPAYFSLEEVFNGNQDDILSANDITDEHIDRLKTLLFTTIHELDFHIANDLMSEAKRLGVSKSNLEHSRNGNTKHPYGFPVDFNTFATGVDEDGVPYITPGSRAEEVVRQINNIDPSYMKRALWNALETQRLIDNGKPQTHSFLGLGIFTWTTYPKWIPSSPLEPGHWEK